MIESGNNNPGIMELDTVYGEMVRELENNIRNGTYVPGKPLPSENLLAEQYRISRTSVRLGLRYLEEAGIVVKRPGKGSFVRNLEETDSQAEKIYTVGLNFDASKVDYTGWYEAKIMQYLLQLSKKESLRLSIMDENTLTIGTQPAADGVILLMYDGTIYDLQRYINNGIDFILFNRIVSDEHIPYVAVNYRYESEEAIRFLRRRGHRRISTFTTYENLQIDTLRQNGYLYAMGMTEFDPELTCYVHARRETGYYVQVVEEFLRNNGGQFTAMFVPNGGYALPIFLACIRLGIRVPEDLELLFFDDIAHLYQAYKIPFHYVKMPLEQMTQDALQYLLDKSKNPQTPVLKRLYSVEILQKGMK